MTFDYFVRNYWSTFVSHLSEFHPLDHEFVARYEYDLDWNSLSKNRKINWTREFIRKYQSHFRWVELARNGAVTWYSEWIEEFNDRLNWQYLRDNDALPLSEEFIQKYQDKITIREDNKYLTDDIRKKYKVWPAPDRSVWDELKKEELDDLETLLSGQRLRQNQRLLYEQFILPGLQNTSPAELFEKTFDYSQRYFFLAPASHDKHGLTPEFIFEKTNELSKLNWDKDLFEISEPITFINGHLQEGPDRLYEVCRLNSSTGWNPLLLVSENVKKYLQTLKLPPHYFHPVNLKLKKIKTTTPYNLLHLNRLFLVKELDFERAKFLYSVEKRGEPKPTTDGFKKIDETFKTHEQFEEYVSKLRDQVNLETSAMVAVFPEAHILKSDFDIYGHQFREIVVTEKVKKDLEQLFPGQFEFKSAQELHIRMNADSYAAKMNAPLPVLDLKPPDARLSEEQEFLFAKMKRLKGKRVAPPPGEDGEDEFSEMERKLGVRFPLIFKEDFREGKADEEFPFLPVSSFYITNEYSERNPETVNAVIVAENGLGDSLGMILERNSDFKLRTALYEFSHENGEVHKLKELG